MKAIRNIKLIQGNNICASKVIIYDNKIVDIINDNELSRYSPDEIIDGKDMYLSPGFIDIHIHGCASYDVMDTAEDNLNIISSNLAKTGVTSFLPTTMTMKLSDIENALSKIKKYIGHTSGAQILGTHLEGPFISKIFKGAHEENYITLPDQGLVEKYKDVIKIITLAPELEGGMDFIKYCTSNNIIISIGHSNADYELAMKAINEGAKHVTHTFNAMSPLKHRAPGVAGAAMLGNVTCELIADNIHVHPAAQNLLVKIKGVDNIILITDAMRACMMNDGEYNLGGQDVILKNNEVRLPNGTLAGSVLTLNVALKHIIENTNVSLADGVKMITQNPSKLLGISNKKGSIDIGKDADMVIFDDKFNVKYTIVNGEMIYKEMI